MLAVERGLFTWPRRYASLMSDARGVKMGEKQWRGEEEEEGER